HQRGPDGSQHLLGLSWGELIDDQLGETPGEGRVVVESARLGGRGRTDDLHLPAGQGRLEDLGDLAVDRVGVRVGATGDLVDLVDEQDDLVLRPRGEVDDRLDLLLDVTHV